MYRIQFQSADLTPICMDAADLAEAAELIETYGRLYDDVFMMKENRYERKTDLPDAAGSGVPEHGAVKEGDA